MVLKFMEILASKDQAGKPDKSKGGKKCKHCDKPKHKGGKSKCWELEENADQRPKNWKSVKED